jgi:hypothetical protein
MYLLILNVKKRNPLKVLIHPVIVRAWIIADKNTAKKVIVVRSVIKNAQNLLGEPYLLMIGVVTPKWQKKTVGYWRVDLKNPNFVLQS